MEKRDGNTWKITLLRLAPDILHNLIFRTILDKTFNKNPEIRKRLKEINGKTFLLEIRDINKSYVFYAENDTVKVDFGKNRKPDVIMQGNFDTFMSLFLHKADADSLFFSRKIVVKGEVKTSVFFKNLLEHL
jgi:predicted lipid carrier protein YhbT